MSYDLNGGLHDLSGDPVSDRDLPLPAILIRLHRTRRVRTASYSALGVATVTAVAIAIAAVGADRASDPLPPVDSPSPTHTSWPDWTPTATPLPTPTPTATPEDGRNTSPRCGEVLGWPDFSDDYAFNTSHDRVASDATSTFRFRGAIAWQGGVEPVTTARLVDLHATVWGLDTWTVVGYADSLTQGVDASSPYSGVPVGADVRLAECDGASLDEGTFYLIATYELTLADGSERTFVNQTFAYVGDEPTSTPDLDRDPMRTGERTGVMSLANRSAAGLPGCGQTYSRGPQSGATATITGWPDSRLGRVGVWLHLTNTGSRVTEGRFGSPIITVTQGGVVVMQTSAEPQHVLYLKDWAASGSNGSIAVVGATVVASACSASDRLPNGDYEVWLVVPLWRTPDTDAMPEFVDGGPYPLTITDSSLSPPAPDPTPTPTPTPEPPVETPLPVQTPPVEAP